MAITAFMVGVRIDDEASCDPKDESNRLTERSSKDVLRNAHNVGLVHSPAQIMARCCGINICQVGRLQPTTRYSECTELRLTHVPHEKFSNLGERLSHEDVSAATFGNRGPPRSWTRPRYHNVTWLSLARTKSTLDSFTGQTRQIGTNTT